MRRTRVVLAEMPTLLHDIVHTILSAEPDIELEPGVVPPEKLATVSASTQADVLIVADVGPPADDYASVLYANPRLRLVAISSGPRRAFLYELRPQRLPLGEMSREALVRAVCAQPMTG